jgi:CubicO group peptidase (beta-lactamase class C family)
MTNRNLALLLAVALVPTALFAKPTLQVVRGGGEFQTLETAITVNQQEALTMQWVNDQAGATGGTWKVVKVGGGTVATGEAPAPSTLGHLVRFTIPANAFLQASPPATPVKFHITIAAHNAAKQPLGSASAAVVVSQEKAKAQPPIDFGPSAVFPDVDVLNFDDTIGVMTPAQIEPGLDLKLRVSNKGKTATDPIWLSISDFNVLMRQSDPQVSIPSLAPGVSKTVSVHLDAEVASPKSVAQLEKWRDLYIDLCGVDLRANMNWRGAQANAPVNDHRDLVLAPQMSRTASICADGKCVQPCQIARNIHNQLDGHVVGYAFFAGRYPKYGSHGKARTSVDGTARDFTPTTKITVASVSKLVTAIAAVRILDKHNVSLNDPIGPYLPANWSASNYVKNIKFSQLLSHTSGIKDYGNVNQDYAALKAFFTQPVSNSTTTACQPSSVMNPSNPINPNNLSSCYSNYNFAIFRILLPKVAGFAEDSSAATRPQTLADQYVKLVQQNVFDRVGQNDVACKPPTQGSAASSYAWAYNFPGTHNGFDWVDVSLQCGAAGWYLSVEDLAKVLLSISAKDGKILAETATKHQFDAMRTGRLGWDVAGDTELEKNGGWGAGCDSNGNHCGSITTSAAVFGPVTGPRVVAVLFINSNISGGPNSGQGAREVLEKAYNDALTPSP